MSPIVIIITTTTRYLEMWRHHQSRKQAQVKQHLIVKRRSGEAAPGVVPVVVHTCTPPKYPVIVS